MTEGSPSRESHWDRAYERSVAEARSWYQTEPSESLRLVQATGIGHEARVLDVGGGTSRLMDRLLDAGYSNLGILDVSVAAIGEAKERLGDRASAVEWFAGDVTRFGSPHAWDIWHDRATFHFLVDSSDRAAYREGLHRSLAPQGHAIIATFSLTGPDRCSGLPCVRYSPETLRRELGPEFELVQSLSETHVTPGENEQDFLYCLFRRTA